MGKNLTRIHKFKAQHSFQEQFLAGVSLHSHTMYSKEYLGRLPTFIAKFPIGHYILEREIGRLHLYGQGSGVGERPQEVETDGRSGPGAGGRDVVGCGVREDL